MQETVYCEAFRCNNEVAELCLAYRIFIILGPGCLRLNQDTLESAPGYSSHTHRHLSQLLADTGQQPRLDWLAHPRCHSLTVERD